MVMSVQFNAGGAVGRFGGGGGGGHLSVGRSGGLSKFALHPMHGLHACMYVCVRSEDRAAALCQAHAVRDVAALSSPGQNDIAADSLTPFPPSRRPIEVGNLGGREGRSCA